MSDVIKKIYESPQQTKILGSAGEALIKSSYVINKGYLSELTEYSVDLIFREDEINAYADVNLFKLDRVVFSNEQSVQESLSSIYTALGIAGFTVFFYLDSDGVKTDFYIGVRGTPNKSQGSNAGRLLSETFKGHFDGSLLTSIPGDEIEDLLQKISSNKDSTESVTAVSGVPSLALDDKESFMQGIERFIDAAEGRKYQALILAEPIHRNALGVVKSGYEQIFSQLSPFAKQQLTYGENQSDSVSEALSYSLSESLGKSISLTETTGNSFTRGHSNSLGKSASKSSATLGSKAISVGASGLVAAGGLVAGAAMVTPIGLAATMIAGGLAIALKSTKTEGESSTETASESNTRTDSVAKGQTDTVTKTDGKTETRTATGTAGSSKSMTIESVNKGVQSLLDQIDQQLDRIDEAKNFGAWGSAAYFIGENLASSEALSSIFLGLMRGKNSHSEHFALTTWDSSHPEVYEVRRWLKNLTHPRLNPPFVKASEKSSYTPASLITGQEMAVQLSLPRKSTSGTAVIQTQSFGRQIQFLDGSIQESDGGRVLELGKIRHLWTDRAQKVKLSIDQLTSHMFVTGSTGSGKSNTVYGVLQQLRENQIPFLVIEPAKGEYKRIFGNQDDVSVFGTNPKISNLLKIDPFAFPPSIHVLEHIDRLVEIFNVCWPMYAAMPAVLKEAILDAYKESGWLLDHSTNQTGKAVFPSFIDVKHSLERVIKASSFSEEVKSNYIGSLVTRITSLTNGLNGQIFVSNEIPSKKLFNQNCIIDLSRVGSLETKSLIMGILLIRLNEYRMNEGHMNAPLRHITVLEEAHNILKATTAQGQEGGASLESKSVEMITNSIAEMRTYGEGFIIVDQSPGAVDISAIRNTNTKIVMRLPEEYDRRIAGKSIGLKDEQIEEISKLPTGVALVSQNNWLEPVLCQINKAEYIEEDFQYEAKNEDVNRKKFNVQLMHFLLNGRIAPSYKIDYRMLIHGSEKLPIPIGLKLELLNALDKRKTRLWDSNNFSVLAKFVVDYLDCEQEIASMIKFAESFSELDINLQLLIKKYFGEISDDLSIAIQQCLMKDFSARGESHLEIYAAWHAYHTDTDIRANL